MQKCPRCKSDQTLILFPNIPWFTHGFCTQCENEFPVTEAEIEEELLRRSRDDDDSDDWDEGDDNWSDDDG